MFVLRRTQANWYKAAQYCRFHGMHLASISSQEENDNLEKHIKDFGEYSRCASAFHSEWRSYRTIGFPLHQASATSTSGRRAPIWPTRATSSGWPTAGRSPSPTGMRASRTTSATRTARRRTAWSCGTVTARASSGTTRRAASRRTLCARCSRGDGRLVVTSRMRMRMV